MLEALRTHARNTLDLAPRDAPRQVDERDEAMG